MTQTNAVSVQVTIETKDEGHSHFHIMKLSVDEKDSGSASTELTQHTFLDSDENWIMNRTKPTGLCDFDLSMTNARIVEPDSPMKMVWEAILEHRRENPDCRYGSNCSVINSQIQFVRGWFKIDANPFEKAEVDAKRDFDRVVRIATGSQW